MPYDGLKALTVQNFGGLNTLQNATDVPQFVSPDCQDVEFVPGRVQQRPGSSVAFSPNDGSNINYTKSYVLPDLTVRNLAIGNTGNFNYEPVTSNPGTDTLIISGFLNNLYPNSVTLFGREWLAMGDGKSGIDLPRVYNGAFVDRLSKSAPGEAPSAVDLSVSITPDASPSGLVQPLSALTISTISEVGTTVTVVLSSALPGYAMQKGAAIAIGDLVKIAGVTNTAYNGTWPVSILPTSADGYVSFSFTHTRASLGASSGGTASFAVVEAISTNASALVQVDIPYTGVSIVVAGATNAAYDGTYTWRASQLSIPPPNYVGRTWMYPAVPFFNTAASGDGTVDVSGEITAGTHQVTVQFLYDSGYLTAPAPPFSWVSAGSLPVALSNIPIGPAHVIARYISFTPISSGQFYYVPTNQNPATVTVINDNFTTTAVFDFAETDLLNGVNINSYFDVVELGPISGITEYHSRIVAWGQANKIYNFFGPLDFDGGFSTGSTVVPLGWTPDTTQYAGGGKGVGITGDAFAITGDGTSPVQGLISQTAFQDYLGNPILSPLVAYTVSVRVSKDNLMVGSGLVIKLVGSGYSQSLTIDVTNNVDVGTFGLFTANFTALPAVVPADLRLQVYGTNLTAGDTVLVDAIEFVPTANPTDTSFVDVSNSEDGETFQGSTGFIQPIEGEGQAVRNCFIIRDFLYIAKEHSLFVTKDDGQNEPAFWEVNQVSYQVGTPSPRGVGRGDEWVVIAAQSGLWLFDGGQLSEDHKLSKEIQPTWDSINWNLGHLIDVKIDTKRKRIYVNVPLGVASTQNNKVLTLDYTEGFVDPAENGGVGRKWAPWNLGANAINLCLQQDGSQVLYLGNNFLSGTVYKLNPNLTSDYGNGTVESFNAINGYWQSGYFQNTTRLNFSYVVANAVGTGTLNLLMRQGDQTTSYLLRGWTLNPAGIKNMERQIQKQHYRAAIRFGCHAVGSTFMIQGFSMLVRDAIWAPVRGVNF